MTCCLALALYGRKAIRFGEDKVKMLFSGPTVPGADRKISADPFASAMQTLMLECAYSVRDELQGENNQIGFVCDRSSRSALYAAIYADFKAKNEIGAIMHGLADLDDKLCPPLQAADMMASLTKELALPRLANVSSKKVAGSIALTPPRLKSTVYKTFIGDYQFMDNLLQCQPD